VIEQGLTQIQYSMEADLTPCPPHSNYL